MEIKCSSINILGASGHGKVVIEIAENMGLSIANVFDGDASINEIIGYKVLPQSTITEDLPLVLAIGSNHTRKRLAESFMSKSILLIHPISNISNRVQIGIGTVIMAGVSINSSVEIGQYAIINTNASIDHDCHLGDYTHVSPNVGLAGNVTVGEGTHIGIGAQVIQGITIGKWATIGAGAVVIRDVPDYAVVVGNPAKIIKYNKEQ